MTSGLSDWAKQFLRAFHKANNFRRDPRIAICVPDEGARPQTIEAIVGQGRISLHFTPEKVIEFSV
jgi:hypothetical protein